jgi:hypothetical protein
MRKTHKQKRHTKRTRKVHRKRKGGAATNLPAPYFKAPLEQPSASAGHDLLKVMNGIIRPRIGGALKRVTRKVGGFVPSIMEGFTQMAGKYVLPIALFSGYKLIGRTKKAKRV